MRRVRASGVEAVFVLAGAQRRARAGRPRAIHINEQKEETKMCAPISQSPQVALISSEAKAGVALMQCVGVWSFARDGEAVFCNIMRVWHLRSTSW